MIMKAIETKGRILPNGNIQLNEPIDAPSGEVRLLILFPEDLRQEIPQKLSPEEKKRIVTVLDGVAELSGGMISPLRPVLKIPRGKLKPALFTSALRGRLWKKT